MKFQSDKVNSCYRKEIPNTECTIVLMEVDYGYRGEIMLQKQIHGIGGKFLEWIFGSGMSREP